MDQELRKELVLSGDWRSFVENEARGWIGTPYQHKGRIKGVGVDCGGILYQVYNPVMGPFKPFPATYPPDWALHQDNEIYLDFIMPYVQQVDKPICGGFTLFKMARNFAHAAIYSKRGTYIHAWGRNQIGHVVESRPEFFRLGGKPREMKHFDVSQDWLKGLVA
jgi:cell wall-associated NlpC family hydrolase